MPYPATTWQQLKELEANFDAFKWLKDEGEIKTKTVECAFHTLMLYQRSRQRLGARSLMQIMSDVRALPEFQGIDENGLILSLLAVVFDSELLMHTKNIRSDPFDRQSVVSFQPKPRQVSGKRGLSLVMYFKMPDLLRAALDRYLEPIQAQLQPTPTMHITLLNLADKLPPVEVTRALSIFQAKLEDDVAEDATLHRLFCSVVQSAALRPELRIMGDGALVLFGSGRRFLALIHRLRLLLISKGIFRPDTTPAFERAESPVWFHCVYTRIVERVPQPSAERLTDWPPEGFPDRLLLEDLRIGLMTFEDKIPVDMLDIQT